MDRRERINDQETSLLSALQGWQTDIWTAVPAIIQSFNPAQTTCEVQPTIRFRVGQPAINTYSSATMLKDQSGNFAWDQMPKLVDCPVVFPSGGGCTLTFPLKLGDECLVVLASRCIDAWWQNGDIQNQVVLRMHDLSDGFVIPGPKSLPRVIPAISTEAAQLRSDDGQAFVEIHPTTHVVKITTPSSVIVTAPTTTVNATTATINATTATINATTATIIASVSATISSPSIVLKNAGAALKKLCNDVFVSLYNGHTHSDPQGGTVGVPNQQATVGTHTTNTVQAE